MRKKLAILFGKVPLLLALLSAVAFAQNSPESTPSTFALQKNDRVVFLGNSLLENDILHGYLELALTTRWPDRNVTFRNLGWSGDNVFGEARSYFTSPPTPYELLMKQITEAQPTVVFVAYGGVEAQEGETGLARFEEGMGKLLDKIQELGAKAVLLSPIPVLSTKNGANTAPRNAMLQRYGAAIAAIAAERGLRFVDVFTPIQEIQKKAKITDNDTHLNETGYYHLALALEKGLGLPSRQENISINLSKRNVASSATARVLSDGKTVSNLKFTTDEKYLPLPLPQEGRATIEPERVLRIDGLGEGYFTLSAEGEQVAAASAAKWAKGVPIRQGTSHARASHLRQMIVKKNDIFFHQYRPHNRTYIVGFRAYEQGRHAEGLKELGLIVTWLEGQISLNRMPTSPVYELNPMK